MHSKHRSPLLLMALTVLIDFTGFGLIIPLLPFWAQRLGANAVGVGLILTVYALAQFIFTPLLGSLSDRYGRKPIIITSLLIETTSLALTALAGSLPILLLIRFMGGIGASNIGSAQAVVSDVTNKQDRAKGMGLIGASIGLGFVIGPLLGGLLSPLGTTLPFWVAASLALANALLVIFLLPETHPTRTAISQRAYSSPSVGGQSGRGVTLRAPRRSPGHAPTRFPDVSPEKMETRTSWQLAAWRDALRSPTLVALIVTNLLFTLAFTAMEALFPLFSQHIFRWGATQNGYLFTYIGCIVIIMQGGLVGRLVKRWNEQSVLLAGLGLLALGLILLAFSNQLALLLLSVGLLSIGDGAVTPTLSTLLSFSSTQETQGATLGLAQGVAGLGRSVGPLVAGAAYILAPGTPFIAGGILVLLALLVAFPALSSIRRLEPATEETITHAYETEEPAAVFKKSIY